MADIKKPIKYNAQQKALIKAKLGDNAFRHSDWSEDDLEELRKAIRDFYRQLQKGFCSYCKGPVSLQSAANCHIEHIAPKSKYRDFIFEPKNLCVICADCSVIKREQETLNEEPDTVKRGRKRKRYPRSTDAFKVVHPHFDDYYDHIDIILGHYYVDKSVKGGHTILYCKLNRRLHAFGWEPEYTENALIMEKVAMILEEATSPQQRERIKELIKLLSLKR